MLVVIRVLLFTILQYRNYFGCQVAVKAYPTGSTMQEKNSNIGAPSSPLLMHGLIGMEKTKQDC